MNILSFLDQLSAANAPADAAPRRHVLRHLGQAGARALAAGLPLALAASGMAQARTNDTTLDAVTVLLKLEDLQVALYTQALAAPAFAAETALLADLRLMQRHQQDHATFLRRTLRDANAAVPTAPSFDFSGQHNNATNPVLFPNVFTDVNSFLQLAQQLEDASVSIYKGQAAFITDNRLLLDAILRMHSAEARHAAHLRTLRRTRTPSVRVKSWPSRSDAAPSPAVQVPATSPASGLTSLYTIEANETHILSGSRLVPFATLLTNTNVVQSNALAEAFDEPLSSAQATALLNIFG
jgi:hypothetical protein